MGVEQILDLPEGVPPLRALYLYLTDGCNLCCRHCWITPTFVNGEPSPGDCLSPELLEQGIREALPLGLKKIKLTGGEPLIHPRFRDIARMITQHGLSQDMETNGTAITEDLAGFLRDETSMGHISVSLDSVTPATHDDFRGRQGAFAAATNGIKHLVNAGFRPQIIMSVHRDNLHEVEGMVELATSLGAKSLKLNPVTNAGRGSKMHEDGTTLSYDQLQALLRNVNGPMQERASIGLNMMAPLAMQTICDLLNNRWIGACNVIHIMGILGSGQMAMCGIGRNVEALCYGKLGSDSLRETWINADLLKEIRRRITGPFPGICGNCIHAPLCRTGCLAMNYMNSGELFSPSVWCQAATDNNSFPETRRRDPSKHEESL